MICHVTPTIMDGIVVRWNPAPDGDAEISASRNGVLVNGFPLILTQHALDEFNRTVSLAWEMYRSLAKAAERGPFARMEMSEVHAWLQERGVHVVERRFGETLAEAVGKGLS